ncbi:MAG: T9SS type A sorting domain-containing protein, partial [candidate division WOR-3 bacterium]
LLAGGHKPTDPTNFYAYNVNDSTWTIKTDVHFGPTYKPWKAGSCLTELGGKIYALKGGDKYNLFFVYDPGTNNWTDLESIPLPDTVFGSYKKKVLVKDGGCMVSDGSAIYAIKGGGTDCFWKYTPGSPGVWEMKEPIPVTDKKHAPKTGAAMAYADGKVWLLVGNKQPDFWCYTIGAGKVVNSQIIASATSKITNESNKFKIEVSPNPFGRRTSIRYTVPVAGKVSIKLYNVNGRLIETITDGYLNAGTYTTRLTAKLLASGIYFLKYEDAMNSSELKLIVH